MLLHMQCFFHKGFQISVNGFPSFVAIWRISSKAFDAGFYVVNCWWMNCSGFSAGTMFAGAFCLHRALSILSSWTKTSSLRQMAFCGEVI